MRTIMSMALLAVTIVLQAANASAQTTWPTRPVRFILPAVPGGGTDTLARTLQSALAAKLGQPIVIENRPGAAFIISTEIVARATDGHTIGMIVVNTHAANATVQDKLPYDSLKDFTPIINLINSPNVIAVHPSFPAKTLADLIDAAKAKPGGLFYATSGIAGGQHFAGEMLKHSAGIDMVHVPYKGSGASLQDAVSGQVKIVFGNVISAGPFLTAGSLRPLAVTSLARSPFFPDVPTVAEQGFPGFSVEDSYGIMGPAGMPPDVVKKLHDAFSEAMQAPELQPRLKQQGIVANLLGPVEFKKFIESEIVKLREIALRANIKGSQ
jgi:tripartite-type tricarboxylate transporter receptor subunit TctC